MSATASLLVVDDEDVVCKSCSKILERQGIKVETTTNPREGLRLATVRDYSAILLDIMMPELGGIEFLERLRQVKPAVPVIIITGYSSVQSAAEAMRLKATDYLPKPFTPEEITQAVGRVLKFPRREEALVREHPRAMAPGAGRWTTAGTEVAFCGEAWLRVGRDGTVRAGAFLPREEAQSAEGLRVARVGDVVYRGLPLAEISLRGRRCHVIPAPLTGEVVEVNQSLLEDSFTAWDDPCGRAWLARIKPTRLAADLLASEYRRVVLASWDEARAADMTRRLAELGCEVTVARGADDAGHLLRRTRGRLLLVDAPSLGLEGPALVRRVLAMDPTVCVVVAATEGLTVEAAYRTQRIFYFALEPFGDNEIVDILADAFRSAPPAPAVRRTSSPLTSSIRSVRVTNRAGERVTLLSSGGALHDSHGLGRALLDRLLAAALPVQVTVGTDELTQGDMSRAVSESDRVVVLWRQDTGRIPGSLSARALLLDGGAAAGKVVTLVVQPAAGERGPLTFDDRTTHALAGALADELAGPGR